MEAHKFTKPSPEPSPATHPSDCYCVYCKSKPSPEPEEWPYPKATEKYVKGEYLKACKEREEFREKLVELEDSMEGVVSVPKDVAEKWLKEVVASDGEVIWKNIDKEMVDAIRTSLGKENKNAN